MTHALGGLIPAALTPLDASGRFDRDAFGPYAAALFDAGADGLYVGGTTGEGFELPDADRRAVVEAAVQARPPGRRVVVHAGATDVDAAVALARHAAAAGADAVSSLPPLGGFGLAETRTYYATLAAATDLPFVVYYFRQRSAAVAGLDDLLALCEIPGVAAVKYTDLDLFTLEGLVAAGVTVFNGHDEVLAAGLLMGASGGIGSTYNVAPGLYRRILDAAGRGDWQEARTVQRDANRLVRVLLRYPLLPAIKATMARAGLMTAHVRPPRTALGADAARQLAADLDALGLPDVLSP